MSLKNFADLTERQVLSKGQALAMDARFLKAASLLAVGVPIGGAR